MFKLAEWINAEHPDVKMILTAQNGKSRIELTRDDRAVCLIVQSGDQAHYMVRNGYQAMFEVPKTTPFEEVWGALGASIIHAPKRFDLHQYVEYTNGLTDGPGHAWEMVRDCAERTLSAMGRPLSESEFIDALVHNLEGKLPRPCFGENVLAQVLSNPKLEKVVMASYPPEHGVTLEEFLMNECGKIFNAEALQKLNEIVKALKNAEKGDEKYIWKVY